MMPSLYRLFLSGQVTRGRLAVVAGAGLLLLLLGAAAGARGRGDWVSYFLTANFGLALLVPVTALVFASAALGDPAEDGTLVYIWLRPVQRWRIVAAALAATLTVTMPLVVVPVTGAALLARAPGGIVVGALVATTLAVVAYASIFVGLGLVIRRALAWGLAYVLIWEGVVAGIGAGPARLSVHLYAQSILNVLAGRPQSDIEVGAPAAVIVLAVVTAAALAATAARLRHQDVK